MEAEGSRVAALAQKVAARLPDALGKPMAEKMGVDRLPALTDAIATVRRGGTISITGVYGGAIDPLPMMDMFDKGIQLRMGQTHVRRWLDDLLPLLLDDADPAGTGDLASHYLPLEQAGRGYEVFQRKDEAAPRWCCSRAAPSRRYTRVPAVP
jgi:threonine dehydrogenase-like Zn-dependent dehydrogenase